ncbi:hypothetical protein HKX48_004414 [Thoreauomyces humboldtii]|nr:hypothetical protein HKX48_004414 [Thoreauomyces humboldtii]
MQSRSPRSDPDVSVCGPAHTVEFVSSDAPKLPRDAPPLPHHVDVCPKGAVLVIKAPATAINAVLGGLMAARAQSVGCAGIVVEGRIRDLRELWDCGAKVWSVGQSTLGTGPFLRLASISEPVTLGEASGSPVTVRNGDVVCADIDGVVCVPWERASEIARQAEASVEIDRRCMEDISNGKTIAETFAKHRGQKK